ncbi:MAG: STAS domain-containing protein [Planctomycetota bacterium]|jgi:anti-anti-sigma factor
MSADSITVAEAKGQCFIRLQGNLRHTLSAGWDAFIDELFVRNPLPEVLVDLTDALYLDSTNLGLLAKMARLCHQRGGRRITLISPGQDINTVLESMGFDQVFLISHQPWHTTGTYEDLSPVDESEREHAELILQTHRNLMEMNEKNEQEFRSVVALLSETVAALQS